MCFWCGQCWMWVVIMSGVNSEGVSGVSIGGSGGGADRFQDVLHLPPVYVAGSDWCWG